MPRHERKPCSGWGFAFMIPSNSQIVRGADLLGFAQHACRRPFRVTPMARRHMLRDRRVLVREARTHVARNPLALVEDLDGGVGEARLNGLPQQSERHRVVMVIDLDVIVRRDRAELPLGILVAIAWKPYQRLT